ncbi:phosphoribosylamine--glycine ligase [Chromobacterium subtsugae]|uniref:Phosphoribosylamine--glycine ligase n=3 Tax=Chromobacterium subtsugae TaxID=251747 RepID=A0ABS7FES9_9NEIS|nr:MULTISPECIES: phosphoribosylamine--glycine ligase [Chromobacterium]KUM04771.1 phosphoribosylamine--glycine ligase [Chromobacterium subtsugae]KZE87438.1 phosphoribosylamine--glycine ligase [Chromobacterium sp. F49]MBW7566584.1 phosphoribosylamine--glycine ligase [Chromobacterium subtsugae]MBW8288271.1 phosphoribosylamine--glycine ligase [Chromobacterium subtsugae]OBU87279.1 phosphoribosylamine--glycine ligase [Chromobacterium subtsugae]
MKVLVIGSGGREHALAWRIAKSRRVSKVFVAPGNAGTALDPNLTNVDLNSVDAWLAFAKQEKVDLTVVGPEAPLAAGVVDAFRSEGLKIFGPSQYCAQLESSKDFAKAFMQRHGIPTAAYRTFASATEAHAYVNDKGAPIVIKADGLAAGKGVVVAMTLDEAHAAIDDMLLGNKMGSAGSRVVIEDFLQGEEASFIVMVDGEHVLPMATSQDHKRLLDHDMGPNTGGMGAYSPAPVVTPAVHNRVMREIINPTVLGMKKDGHPYTGFLYAGLMIDADGKPHTIEFNCRFGDPETQPIMARLKTDFTMLLEAGVNGRLDKVEAEWDRRVALGVVLAAAGYPDAPRKGDAIHGIPHETDDGVVFHAGTALDGEQQLRSHGGRVLCAVGLGDSVKMAQGKAYLLADAIDFAGKQYRRDIGARAIGRKV